MKQVLKKYHNNKYVSWNVEFAIRSNIRIPLWCNQNGLLEVKHIIITTIVNKYYGF